MSFLFGKKYPIFNREGEIEHKRKSFFKKWRESYTKDPDKNWRNHSGINFKDKTNSNKGA